MNKINLFFKEYFISWDFLVFTITIILTFAFDFNFKMFEKFYLFISSKNDMLSIKILIGLHGIIFIWIANVNKKILFPGEKFNKILINFPLYENLKMTTIVAMIEPCISIVLLLILVIFDLSITDTNKIIFIIGLCVYTSISVITTYFAEGKLTELLYRNEPYN